MITVISTGFRAPTKQRCIDSVRAQKVECEHRYIEASEQDPPLSVTENVWLAIKDLPPDRVVAWLDGDDWLTPDALEHVEQMYRDGADCTYGSFRFSDGRVPRFGAYDDPKKARNEPWRATHLKTFRAGLMPSRDELQMNGEWIDMCNDMAVMFGVLDRAKNPVFCPRILCVYNYAASWEFRFTNADRKRNNTIEAYLRSRLPVTSVLASAR